MALPKWAYIPTAVIDEQRNEEKAKTWADGHRAALADDWAALQRQQALDLTENWLIEQSEVAEQRAAYPGQLQQPTFDPNAGVRIAAPPAPNLGDWAKLGAPVEAMPAAEPYGADPSKLAPPGDYSDPLAAGKLTTTQGGPADDRDVLKDFPTPDPPSPMQRPMPRVGPFGAAMPPPLPVEPAKPVPPDQEQQQRVRGGRGPLDAEPDPLAAKLGITDMSPALTAGVGGLARQISKQQELSIGGAEGTVGAGFRHLDASDAAMGRRAFTNAVTETSGAGGDSLVSAARGMGDVSGAGGAMGAPRRRYDVPDEVMGMVDDLPDESAPAARGALARKAEAAIEPVEQAPPSRIPTVRALEDALTKGLDTSTGIPLSRRLESVRVAIVRRMTDRQVDLAEFQKTAQKHIGRDLSPDEMAYELSRLNADRGAEVLVQEGLRPVLRQAGADRGKLSVWLRLEETLATGTKGADGYTPDRAAQALADLADELGPDRAARVQEAASRARSFAERLERRRIEAGLPPSKADQPLMRDVAEERPGDPLTYLMRRAYEVEEEARRNDVFAAFARLSEFHPDLGTTIRRVAVDHKLPPDTARMGGEGSRRLVTGWVDGERRAYAMPKELALTIDQEKSATIPGLATVMGVVRALITSRNPAFLASNAVLDALSYVGRTASREGGSPHRYPAILADLGAAYFDAFKGLATGTIEGEASKRFLAQGGGQFGFFGGEQAARSTLDQLGRSHALEVKNAGDLARLVGDLVTLKPVESIGERIELAPRVAAMRRAEKAGQKALAATIAGRSVTLDFAQAGSLVRTLNGFSMFLNAGVQGAMTPARAFKENPRGVVATAATMLVAPVVAAEAWNRSDEQRAKDYDDVPQGVRDSGVVIMLPGEAPVDAKGERKPQFVHIRTREWSPFVVLTRETAARTLGAEPRAWQELLAAGAKGASPVQGESLADVATSFAPPVGGTALQLGYDYDAFRGRPIATDARDESASPVSRSIADGLTAALAAAGLGGEVRPSQVEFAIRDTTGGVGQMALAGDELRRDGPKNSQLPQDVPVAGGVVKRFVRGDTGDRLDRARDDRLTDAAREVLRSAGIRYEPGPVKPEVQDQPLKRDQWADYQRLVNERADVAILALAQTPEWQEGTAADRDKMVRVVVAEARRQAEDEMAAELGITPTPQPTSTPRATPQATRGGTRVPTRTATPTPDLGAGFVKRSPTATEPLASTPTREPAATRAARNRAATAEARR